MFPIIGFPEISSNKSSLYNQFLLQSNLKEIYIKSPLKYVKEIKVPSHVTFKTSQKLTPLFWSFYSIKQAGNGNKTQASFQFSLAGSSWLKWKQNKGNFFVSPNFLSLEGGCKTQPFPLNSLYSFSAKVGQNK